MRSGHLIIRFGRLAQQVCQGIAGRRLQRRGGQAGYSIGENRYLADHASTLSYDVTITVDREADTWGYEERTMLQMTEFDEPFAHTDHNTLRRVG